MTTLTISGSYYEPFSQTLSVVLRDNTGLKVCVVNINFTEGLKATVEWLDLATGNKVPDYLLCGKLIAALSQASFRSDKMPLVTAALAVAPRNSVKIDV